MKRLSQLQEKIVSNLQIGLSTLRLFGDFSTVFLKVLLRQAYMPHDQLAHFVRYFIVKLSILRG